VPPNEGLSTALPLSSKAWVISWPNLLTDGHYVTLQMRCIGAVNPPCTRCSKNNRECVVRLPKRQKNRLFSRSKASTVQDRADISSPNSLAEYRPSPGVTLTHSVTGRQGVPQRPAWENQNSPRDQKILLSLFSSPPITIASGMVSESDSPPSNVAGSQHRSGPDSIPDSVILDLVQLLVVFHSHLVIWAEPVTQLIGNCSLQLHPKIDLLHAGSLTGATEEPRSFGS